MMHHIPNWEYFSKTLNFHFFHKNQNHEMKLNSQNYNTLTNFQ
jgi:hypothetical protein